MYVGRWIYYIATAVVKHTASRAVFRHIFSTYRVNEQLDFLLSIKLYIGLTHSIAFENL